MNATGPDGGDEAPRMGKLLLIAWSAVLGAGGGVILTLLGSLTRALPLTSGENSAIATAAYWGMLLGAIVGGLWGWHRSRQ
jgi:hypothetical protein